MIQLKKDHLNFQQDRINTVIKCDRNIFSKELHYCKDVVCAALKANIPINAIENLEESVYFHGSNENNLPSIGNIGHLGEDVLPIVNAEDIEILKSIICQGNLKCDDRPNILAYEHFSVVFNDTPSFAEAEVSCHQLIPEEFTPCPPETAPSTRLLKFLTENVVNPNSMRKGLV